MNALIDIFGGLIVLAGILLCAAGIVSMRGFHPLLFLLMIGGVAQGQEVQLPAGTIINADTIAIGRQIFFDTADSVNGTKSCASCHSPEGGKWVDDTPVSEGILGRKGTRRSQTIEDAMMKLDLFHDGRGRTGVGQASQPFVAQAELGNQSVQQVVNRFARRKGYRDEFQEAFRRPINVGDFLSAIAAFESTIVHSDAPIDRYARGETWVFNKQQERGRFVFFYEGCDRCHSGKNFTDGQFHNLLGRTRDRNGQLDIGRGKISQRQSDNFKFVTPTLRDVGKRLPVGHAGQFPTMRSFVDYLNDPVAGVEIGRMNLTDDDCAALTVFLETAFESEHPPIVTEPSLPR